MFNRFSARCLFALIGVAPLAGVAQADQFHLLLFDTTGSMGTSTISPFGATRFDVAKNYAKLIDLAFLPPGSTTRIAVAHFNTSVGLSVVLGSTPLTVAGRLAINNAIDMLPAPGGATNLADAMCESVSLIELLASGGDEAYLWVYTDGDENSSSGGWPSTNICFPCASLWSGSSWPDGCSPNPASCPGPFASCSPVQTCIACEITDPAGRGIVTPRYFGSEIESVTPAEPEWMNGEWVTRGVDADKEFLRAIAGGTGGFFKSVADNFCPGDTNGDGATDLIDIAIMLSAYGTSRGDRTFNSSADLVQDNQIDIDDLAFLLAHYGCGPN